MYNFYLIATRADSNEPVFEKVVLSEDDAKTAGFEDFEEYVQASLDALADACIKEEANFVIINQEEFMKLVLKMSQKL
jgi:hypothetical protein